MRVSSVCIVGGILALSSCGGTTPPLTPFITTDRASIGFGQEFGSGTIIGMAPQESLTVSNEGQGDLHISNIAYTGDPAFMIMLASSLPITVLGEQKTYVQIIFTPTQPKLYSGKVTITSDAANETSLDVAISGLGVAQCPDGGYTLDGGCP